MNVLKADFVSKQKRLLSRRKRVMKTFFSGYHTISNIASPFNGCQFPIVSANNSKIKVALSPKQLISCGYESAEPKFLSSNSSEVVTRENDPTNKRDKKDSTTDSSLEFQKLLEPFLNVEQNLPSINEDNSDTDNDLKNPEISMENLKVWDEECVHEKGNEEVDALKRLNLRRKTPKSFLRCLKNFNKDAFKQCNVSENVKRKFLSKRS